MGVGARVGPGLGAGVEPVEGAGEDAGVGAVATEEAGRYVLFSLEQGDERSHIDDGRRK